MRTIGIDLGIRASHQAVIVDDRGNAVGTPFRFETDPDDLAALLERARAETDPDEPIRVILEPTGSIWLPVASYLIQRQVAVYLVNTQDVAELRKFYSRHAKSDRISARVLARLPWVKPEMLHGLHLASADYLAGQRACRQREALVTLMSAIKNRVQAWERAFWPGLEQVVKDRWTPWMRRWREDWYDPWQLQDATPETLQAWLVEEGVAAEDVEMLATGLQAVARRAVKLLGTPDGQVSLFVDYAVMRDQVLRELRLLAVYEAEQDAVSEEVRQLYRRVHPEQHLESLRGVGEEGAAVYLFFAHDVQRFASQKQFRSWSGLVPGSDQSGDVEKKGVRITAAGPDLVKKYAYINAEVARQWDPQLAAIYYDQMVHKGKHHIQAVCCCATHLLDRVRVVLRDGRPYELRDVDGRQVTKEEARKIVLERYQVPEEVRQRRRNRTRKDQRAHRAEGYEKRRRSHPGK